MCPSMPVTEPTPRPRKPLIHTVRRTSAMDLTLSWERVSGGLNALDMTIDVWKILIYEKAVLMMCDVVDG